MNFKMINKHIELKADTLHIDIEMNPFNDIKIMVQCLEKNMFNR